MAQNYGSKRLVVGAHYGLRDWLAQRITAALMALFTLVAAGAGAASAARSATTSGPASSRASG